MKEVMELVGQLGAVPIAFIDKASDVLPLCGALSKGGLPMLEICLRTPAAMDAIRFAADNCPDFPVGAGTVLSVEQAKEAKDAGASFIVSPGSNPRVINFCLENRMPILAGVVTPTEIEAAIGYGLDVVKFFPAEANGGAEAIRQLSGPYSGLKFVPTGGLMMNHLKEYLSVSSVMAVGSVWVCTPELISAGKFEEIEAIARETANIVRSIRTTDKPSD